MALSFPAVRSVLWVREALGAPYVLGWRPSINRLRLELDAVDLLRAAADSGGAVDLFCRMHASSLVLQCPTAAAGDGCLLTVVGVGAPRPLPTSPPQHAVPQRASPAPLHLSLALEGGEGGALYLRARAEVPTLTLHVQPLALPPRLAPTPLARAGPLRTTPSPVLLCCFGLLTLDQTRNAVMLLAGDPSARTTPVVGLWFRQADSTPTVVSTRPAGALPPWAAAAIACSTFRAACVWYEESAGLERVRPPGAPRTLLAALLPPCGDATEGVFMVEVTASWPERSAGAAADPPSVPYGPHSWGADGWLSLTSSLTLPAVGPPSASPGTARQSGTGVEWDLLPHHGGGAPCRIPHPRAQGGSPRRHPSEGTLSPIPEQPWRQGQWGRPEAEAPPFEELPEREEAPRPPVSLAAMRAELEGLTSRLRGRGVDIRTFAGARTGQAPPPPQPSAPSLPAYAGAPLPAFVTEVLARHAARGTHA